MPIRNALRRVCENSSDYIWSGTYKSTNFGIRLVTILLLSNISDDPGYILALYALIELLKVFFDFGMEVQIINGLSKTNSIKSLFLLRLSFGLVGQALVFALIAQTYSGPDLNSVMLISFFFILIMLQGFTTATMQSNQAFWEYLNSFWCIYPISVTLLFMGWVLNSSILLIAPEIFLTISSTIYVKRLSDQQANVRSISVDQYFTGSKHYAANSFLSTFYTRIDAVIVFVYSLQVAATEFLYVQRIMSVPLFIVSFLASVYLTKIASDRQYIHNGIYLLSGSAALLILYTALIIDKTNHDVVAYALIFLTALKIINAYITAAVVALGGIKIVSKISLCAFFLSTLAVLGWQFFRSIAYLPVVLIFLESIVFIFAFRWLRKNGIPRHPQ